jgi:predicted amidohydrolase
MRRLAPALVVLAACASSSVYRVVEEGPAGPDTFRVAVIHLSSLNRDRSTREAAERNLDANVARVSALVRAAARAGADLVLTPEYATTGRGFALEDRLRLSTRLPATPTPGPLWEEKDPAPAKHLCDYARLADELDLWLVVNVLERDRDDGDPVYFNALVALAPDGRMVARYRKINLWFREIVMEDAGGEIVCFDTPFGRFGMLVCFDAIVPWTWGKTSADCDFLLVPTLWQHQPVVGHAAMALLATLSNRPVLWSNQARGGLGGGAGVFRPWGGSLWVPAWAPPGVVVANLHRARPGTTGSGSRSETPSLRSDTACASATPGHRRGARRPRRWRCRRRSRGSGAR